jgi:hypothetical protein
MRLNADLVDTTGASGGTQMKNNWLPATILAVGLVAAALVFKIAPGPGRYQILRSVDYAAWVMNTQTGHLWMCVWGGDPIIQACRSFEEPLPPYP